MQSSALLCKGRQWALFSLKLVVTELAQVATEELVEKGTVALSETATHWLLAVAGTCVHCRSLYSTVLQM